MQQIAAVPVHSSLRTLGPVGRLVSLTPEDSYAVCDIAIKHELLLEYRSSSCHQYWWW